jgi:hypothetical protein
VSRTIPLHLPCLMLLACNDGQEGPGDETPAGQERLCQVNVECPGNILDDPKAPCTMRVVDADGVGLYDGPAGFELRGRSSLYFPKSQYAVELRQYQELPVWPGSPWAFHDDGTDPGANWRLPGFNDSGWSTGPAPLGYGGDYLQTTVSLPQGGGHTTYFRYEFSVFHPEQVTGLELGWTGNDGAAIYLNGTEVLRDNLPTDAAYDTLATAPRTGLESASWHTVKIEPSLVASGTNLLAVEVHRSDPFDSDLRFDLFLEATGDDQPVDFYEMGTEEDWILNGQYVDRSLFRNRLAYDLFQSFGGPERYATETRFCEMTLDGEYRGLYTLGERIERDDDRLDIGKGGNPGDSFIVKLDDGLGFHPNAVGYGTWQMEYPDPDFESEAAVSTYLAGWESAVLGPDPAHPDSGIFAWLDLDSAVDWVLINEFMKNYDAYLLSVYLWRDEGGKMHFTPWDFDLSMGSYPYTDCTSEGWVPRVYWDAEGQKHDLEFIAKMAEVPAFRERLAERWQELRADVLSEEAILERIEGYDAVLAPVIEPNFESWPIQDIAFSTIYPVQVDNWLCPVSSYDEEHERVLSFVSERLAWMDANISNF